METDEIVPPDCRKCKKWCLALFRWMSGNGHVEDKCLKEKTNNGN